MAELLEVMTTAPSAHSTCVSSQLAAGDTQVEVLLYFLYRQRSSRCQLLTYPPVLSIQEQTESSLD